MALGYFVTHHIKCFFLLFGLLKYGVSTASKSIHHIYENFSVVSVSIEEQCRNVKMFYDRKNRFEETADIC